MKVYQYNPLRYFLSAIAPAFLLLGVLCWGILGLAGGEPNDLCKLILIVVPMILISNVGAANQPNKITEDEERISFYGFGRKHEYPWKELAYLKVKEFPFSDKVYVRIGEGKLLSGRYWLDLYQFEEGQELLKRLKAREMTIHLKTTNNQRLV